jgi:hypothetical protein
MVYLINYAVKWRNINGSIFFVERVVKKNLGSLGCNECSEAGL